MEQFNSNNLEEQSFNPEQLEKQDLLMRRWDIEAFERLENLWDINATRDIVLSIASNNPLFSENLWTLQNNIWNSFITEITKSIETQKEWIDSENDILNYFSLDSQKIWELQTELKEVWLDIFNVLSNLQEFIESNLDSLPEEYKEKIKTSIGIKTLNISDIVTEMKNESTSAEDFKNKRWMLDEKIWDAYNFYTAKLFPTLQVKLSILEGKEIPSITQKPFLWEWSFKDGTKYNNPRYVNIPSYMEEIDELLNAPVDSNGNFDEGFFSTQSLLENNDNAHKALLNDMWIESIDNVSLLNDKDKKIQQDAMISYFILIGVQMIPYLGAPISLWVDWVDTFSSHDGTLKLWKSLWIIDGNFQMEKEWYDNVLWWVWLALTAVGLQWISRWKKLSDSFVSLEKIWFWRIEEVLQVFWNKLWITGEKLQSISDYLKSLFKWDIDEASKWWKVENIIFSSDEIERLNKAEEFDILWMSLTEKQKKAIIEAHNIWKRLEDETYSLWDLKEKVRILQEADFKSSEIRILFDKNICWTEYPKFSNIYEDPRYSFLSEYRDILWDITENDIIGEWMNAIILKHPNKDDKLVLKIAKSEKSNSLMDELSTHSAFRDKLLELRLKYKEWKEKELLDGFSIPKVSIFWVKEWVYEMEYIKWKNFRNVIILEYYKNELSDIPVETIQWLTDNWIDNLLRERWLQLYPTSSIEMDDRWMISEDRNFIIDIESDWSKIEREKIKPILNILEKEWYKHNDEHWWNFLQWNDWKIYMIDFWMSKIYPKK